MDFRNTHVFSAKKADNSANFASGGVINLRTHQNSVCKDKNKHWMNSDAMVCKAMIHVKLPRMRKPSPARSFLA
jgi:hypothetical protein